MDTEFYKGFYVEPKKNRALETFRKASNCYYTSIMMIEQQSTGSASPTGLAHHHSGEETMMTTYTISISCECGALTGERCTWTGPTGETEIIEYMPEDLIQSHVAAGHRSIGAAGTYPHNGACRIRVEQSCAHNLLHAWQDGERTSEIDPWVRRVA